MFVHYPPFTQNHPPFYTIKSGHLLSDYQKKCENGTHDILMLKPRKMTILAIITFQENVREGAFFLLKDPLKFFELGWY